MRLIDADALTQKESVMRKGCAYIEEINNAPTIDAGPVVRCKECKWGKPYSDKQLKCNALGLGGLKFPDDFCSYGERREP